LIATAVASSSIASSCKKSSKLDPICFLAIFNSA